MPTYSYHCDSCGHDFDAVQRFSDDALTECPECGALIRRVIQPVGVVFKGSGWYITDSRKGSGESTDTSDKSKTTPDKSDKAEKSDSSAAPAKPEKSEAAKAEKPAAKVAD